MYNCAFAHPSLRADGGNPLRIRLLFKFLSQTQMRKSRPEMICEDDFPHNIRSLKSGETCSHVGDVAEDSVERKKAADRTEAGEVVKAEVLVIHNDSRVMLIDNDGCSAVEENLVAFIGSLVHQQDDHLQSRFAYSTICWQWPHLEREEGIED